MPVEHTDCELVEKMDHGAARSIADMLYALFDRARRSDQSPLFILLFG